MYWWSFARGDRLGVYDFSSFVLVLFCSGFFGLFGLSFGFFVFWFFFFFVLCLPMFCFYICFCSVIGTDPETIVQSPHFAFVCFLTLAWGWFYTKLELRFSICFCSLGTVFPFTFYFRVLMLKDTRRCHWLQRVKTYALVLENMAP